MASQCSRRAILALLHGISFLSEVISVISTVSVDVNQCEAVIAENTSVALGTVREVPKRHFIHLALFGIKGVLVPGCEKERCIALKDARDIGNRPNRILRIQMEHDAPCNRRIEQSIGERAGLNNSSNGKRFGAVLLKVCKHRTRTI